MLEEITIQNLGVIEQATLPFTPGFTVITGETGAGKTMILNALGLLLGKRADSSIVRDTATFTSVEGCWNAKNLPTRTQVEETGAVIEDDMLYINRTVYKDGKSRAVVGGKTTPASTLAAFGGGLVHIHGQADQMRLKNPNQQREALDSYAKKELVPLLTEYKTLYQNRRELIRKIDDVKNNMVARQRAYEELSRAIEELENFRPQPGEDDALRTEVATLMNLETIQEALTLATGALTVENDYGIPDPITAVDMVIKNLEPVIVHDKQLEELHELATTVQKNLQELSYGLSTYFHGLDEDSITRLNEAQERIAGITRLTRKYGPTLDDVLAYWEDAVEKVVNLDPENNNLEELEKELTIRTTALEKLAQSISLVRKTKAAELEKAVNTELEGLAMKGSQLVVTVTELEDFTATGKDEVRFKLKTPAAKEPQLLEKSASGGELSRIMLSLELVLADNSFVQTYFFDEIDAGIGGETGLEIGKRLAILSKNVQVVVVSHLAQVAVFADNHLKITKTYDGSTVLSTTGVLDETGREQEIARMLSGLAESDFGKKHANELLSTAHAHKNK